MDDYFGDELLTAYEAAASQAAMKIVTLSIGERVATLYFAGDVLPNILLQSLRGLIVDQMLSPKSAFKIFIWDAANGVNFLSHKLQQILRSYDRQTAIFDRNKSFFQYNPEGATLSYVSMSKRCAFYFVANPCQLPDYEISSPMRAIMHWFCRMNGMLLVHAAAVAYEGKGLLLTGHGGSGKSTTALLALLNGFDFVGDDYVVIEPMQDKWLAHQIYRGCKLMPDALSRLPQLAQFVIKVKQTQPKQVLMLHEGFGRLVSSLTLDVILKPNINHAKQSSFQTLPMMALLRAFAGSTILQMPGAGADMLADLMLFCRHTPAFSFLLGHDFSEVIVSLKKFLTATMLEGN